jgi:hypothetical protein
MSESFEKKTENVQNAELNLKKIWKIVQKCTAQNVTMDGDRND